jgi:hypothetical protein
LVGSDERLESSWENKEATSSENVSGVDWDSCFEECESKDLKRVRSKLCGDIMQELKRVSTG